MGRKGMIDTNAMTANEDGTYTKVYEAVSPFEKAVSLKVTNGTDWIGTSYGKNVAALMFCCRRHYFSKVLIPRLRTIRLLLPVKA